MDYESKKLLFKYILKKEYEIKKHDEYNDILYINFDTFKIKCKYFLLFNVIQNKLLWAFENPYCSINETCHKIYNKIDDDQNAKIKNKK